MHNGTLVSFVVESAAKKWIRFSVEENELHEARHAKVELKQETWRDLFLTLIRNNNAKAPKVNPK